MEDGYNSFFKVFDMSNIWDILGLASVVFSFETYWDFPSALYFESF